MFKSKIIAEGIIGITCFPTICPIFFSARYFITPDAESRPNALPPLRTMALIISIVFSARIRSVSLVPGAAPLTSTPGTAPSSAIMTVQPVALLRSV